MSDILRKIETYKRREIADAKVRVPRGALEREVHDQTPPRGFIKAIERERTAGRFALIAEIKKASPFEGPHSRAFRSAGARQGVSIGRRRLPVGPHRRAVFSGQARACRHGPSRDPPAGVAQGLPVRSLPGVRGARLGADCILIILAAVDDETARTLNKTAHDLGLDVLVEVHDEPELERALALEVRLIGINNRDLRTFHTTLEVCERLARLIPKDRVVVGESGISRHADCQRLAGLGIETFLVGEALMRQENVAAATRALLTGVESEPITASR